jgi:hypothetical protein
VLTCSATSLTGEIGDGECTIPAFTLLGTLVHSISSTLVHNLPVPVLTSTGLVGEVADGGATLPSLELSSTGYDIPVGTLSSSLPAFIIRGVAQSSDRFASDVLRYTRP